MQEREARGLQIKRLAFLDILKRESDMEVEDENEQFNSDFVLMTGELSLLLADLVEALGGEKANQPQKSGVSTERPPEEYRRIRRGARSRVATGPP